MWQFVQISDPHLASTRDGVWNNGFLCSMMPDVMQCLKKDLATRNPEFILATGDIVSTQTREAMLEARDQMNALNIPYYPMGGNHDFVVSESRDWFLEAFHNHLPQKSTYYHFTHNNLRFIVLDPWWLWSDNTLHPISEASVREKLDNSLEGARWALPPEQIQWLQETLQNDTVTPTIIACHYPLIPIPERRLRPDFNNGGCLNNGKEICDLLSRHPQVKAVFTGHVHIHFIEEHNGLTHICTGALPEFPTEYRSIQVTDTQLHIQTHPLSDPQFAERSLIIGKDWTKGDPQDRECTIPLK